MSLEDRDKFALMKALGVLAKAGRNDEFSEGFDDPHVANESYTEAKFRFQTVNERLEDGESSDEEGLRPHS